MIGISAIVPVYNAEKYLTKCIDSILTQTYDNFELILIDDGSTDRSGEICDRYAETDERITVIHKENGGVSAARNTGIDIAKGKYITFIDSDDFVEKSFFEYTVDIAQKRQADCVTAGIRYWYEDNSKNRDCVLPDIYFSVHQDLNEHFAKLYEQHAFDAMYAKLYKNEIIQSFGIRFDTSYAIFEDGMFVSNYLSHCRFCYFTNKVFYNYVQHDSPSLMKQFNANADRAFQARYGSDVWMLSLLDRENQDQYCRKMFRQWLGFSLQIYVRFTGTCKDKRELLTNMVNIQCMPYICRYPTTNPKEKILQILIKNKMCAILHVLLYLKSSRGGALWEKIREQ